MRAVPVLVLALHEQYPKYEVCLRYLNRLAANNTVVRLVRQGFMYHEAAVRKVKPEGCSWRLDAVVSLFASLS